MNVFILDKSMEKSAQMLDDAHLISQINEGCQILMANYNKWNYPDAKIGHVNHPVTVFYRNSITENELYSYLFHLTYEYKKRFGKAHQNSMFLIGYMECMNKPDMAFLKEFSDAKTYVNGIMTNDISEIRKYISTKPMQKKPTWTNREKPDWWEGKI